MPRSDQLLALLRSHVDGDAEHFITIAMQMAAHEARSGHARLAGEVMELVDEAKRRQATIDQSPGPTPIAQPRGELASLVSVSYPKTKLNTLVISDEQRRRLRRVVQEQLQSSRIAYHGLQPRKKLLLVGPPGSGKTMTASALAGELRIPLFTILLEGVITKFLGETATKLRVIFDAMPRTRGVFLFDEFDAIGAKRTSGNDVGEVRRILNSFLTMLESDPSASLIVCATNHPELLDPALFRRFDDVIEYHLPTEMEIEKLLRTRLERFGVGKIDLRQIVHESFGLSQAEIVRAADEAAKTLLLENQEAVTKEALLTAVVERKQTRQPT